jgi:hypothetical protein
LRRCVERDRESGSVPCNERPSRGSSSTDELARATDSESRRISALSQCEPIPGGAAQQSVPSTADIGAVDSALA